MSYYMRFIVRTMCILPLLFVLLDVPMTVKAQDTRDYLSRRDRTNGRNTVSAFSEITHNAGLSVVEILSDDEVLCLGTVWNDQGIIVTKASEWTEKATIRLQDGSEVEPELQSIDGRLDLAVLQISPDGLKPIQWAESSESELGDWVAAFGEDIRTWVGVISAIPRKIKKIGGAMGVVLDSIPGRSDRVILNKIYKGSAAETAGLLEGDVILSINGKIIDSETKLVEMVKGFDPGSSLDIKIERGEKAMSIDLVLGYRAIFDFTDRNMNMSDQASRRRSGFPKVIQHHIPLKYNVMGGPLLNLKGEAIGINIARVDRVTTYALPLEIIREALEKALKAETAD